VDALGWRLAAVLQGRAPARSLAAYDRERQFGADENIANSTRATRFMTPADGIERLFRDQVLALAAKADFARPMVNSGRLSKPCIYPLPGAPDAPGLPAESRPGSVAPDAPMGNGWLIDAMGTDPVVLAIGCDAPGISGAAALHVKPTPEIARRYLGDASQAIYLIRPDQVIAARWTRTTADDITAALAAMWEGV
jgi:3-(3-hydroxy-phenyl)propionate hydroxylase